MRSTPGDGDQNMSFEDQKITLRGAETERGGGRQNMTWSGTKAVVQEEMKSAGNDEN